ncbi:MAG: hypothetical protein NTW35_01625 [Candidatus Nomurabacteria bacterium]|nr:hypothetical protein [Candidatus Nomurabacteria bacterium]
MRFVVTFTGDNKMESWFVTCMSFVVVIAGLGFINQYRKFRNNKNQKNNTVDHHKKVHRPWD